MRKTKRSDECNFLFLGNGHTSNETDDTVWYLEETDENYQKEKRKSGYQRSARSEARIATKKNATSILACWTFLPFRWIKNRFRCSFCDESFTKCNSLRDHVRLCSALHTTTDAYKNFREMSLINVDVTDAYCRICSTPFVELSQMRDHVADHGFEFDTQHPDGVLPFTLDKESWKCFVCSEKFNNFLKMYKHMNIHYQHYICDACGKGFMTAYRLRKHSEVHNSGSFDCDVCGKIFAVRPARDAHKATAHRKGPRYECPQCNIRFVTYYDRMAHLKEMHSENDVVYQCSYCDVTFKTSGSRSTHIRNCHILPQRVHKCSSCPWKFKTSYELKRHMVRHTLKGENTCRCNLCGKTFLRMKALAEHVRSHSREDLNCGWCGLAFKQTRQLAIHLRTIHEGDMTNTTPVNMEEII